MPVLKICQGIIMKSSHNVEKIEKNNHELLGKTNTNHERYVQKNQCQNFSKKHNEKRKYSVKVERRMERGTTETTEKQMSLGKIKGKMNY